MAIDGFRWHAMLSDGRSWYFMDHGGTWKLQVSQRVLREVAAAKWLPVAASGG